MQSLAKNEGACQEKRGIFCQEQRFLVQQGGSMSTRPLQEMEARWQRQWELDGVYATDARPEAERFYGLVEFPFPSGDGLHVGHVRSYVAIDTYTRRQRMSGKNVLHPMGWDAFGLPTENYAIKHKIRPQEATAKNVANFTRQQKAIGLGYDWSREINTTDPAYVRWTQWQFLQFVKHGMAAKSLTEINWCPACKIGLANEEAQGGVCERCGNPVEKREKSQWMINITSYAHRLAKELDQVDYVDMVRTQQRNWIGQSEGATIRFATEQEGEIEVFTTRPDTLFGVTYVVLAPEHVLVKVLVTDEQRGDVEAYQQAVRAIKDEDRLKVDRPKTGVFTGAYALHPLTGERLPVWIADYVLASYGTGAVMAVPAHDERDFAFAQAYGLAVREVIQSMTEASSTQAFTGNGVLVASGAYDGLTSEEAKKRIVADLEKAQKGRRTTTCKLRDWVFSRQRYWGEPIPLVKCEACAKKPQKAVIVHGYGFTPQDAWYQQAKTALEAAGFTVEVPALPNPTNPSFEAWMEVLVPLVASLGKDDVLVGHSLGGLMALHAWQRAGVSIGRLFLVAPLVGPIAPETWKAFAERHPDRDITEVQRVHALPLDWEVLTRAVTSANVLVSDNDTRVPKATHEVYPKGWFIKSLGECGHFTRVDEHEVVHELVQARSTGWIPVPEAQLPVELPPIEAYVPSENGESPLAAIRDWVETTCPDCGGPAERETDTMPNWAGSSWYFLRYIDPSNTEAFASDEAMKRWLPVSLYNGGMEHTTLHLLYSRFWYKFLHDCGFIPQACGTEPYAKRRSHGLVLAPGGEKMSKSKGNVVNPDDVIAQYGADVLRVYELFLGPFDQAVPWDMNGIEGVRKFLDRVWTLYRGGGEVDETSELATLYHQTIKKLTEGIDQMQFNTCVSQLMILMNAYHAANGIPRAHRQGFLQVLAPLAPHITEELWMYEGQKTSIHLSAWPVYDASRLEAPEYELAVQVNGKLRGTIIVSRDVIEAEAVAQALQEPSVAKWTEGKTVQRVIFIAGRLLNIIIA